MKGSAKRRWEMAIRAQCWPPQVPHTVNQVMTRSLPLVLCTCSYDGPAASMVVMLVVMIIIIVCMVAAMIINDMPVEAPPSPTVLHRPSKLPQGH